MEHRMLTKPQKSNEHFKYDVILINQNNGYVGWVEERNPTALLIFEQYMAGFVPQPDLQRRMHLIIKLTLIDRIPLRKENQ